MATIATCPKCRTALPAAAGCPKCGDRKPRGDAFGESLLAKLEAAEGKPLALKERAKPAAERQGKAKPIQTAVALIAAGLGLAGAVVAMVYLINRDRPINSVGGDTNVAKMETFFTVKLKLHGDKGKVVRRKQFNSQEHVNRLLDAQGKVALGRELKKTVVDEVDFEEIVLEIDEGAPGRRNSSAPTVEPGARRTASRGCTATRAAPWSSTWKTMRTRPLVLGELGLDEAELKELASRVATQERVAAFLPAKGNVVKVGEPWPIDLAAFSRILSANATIDSKNSTGKRVCSRSGNARTASGSARFTWTWRPVSPNRRRPDLQATRHLQPEMHLGRVGGRRQHRRHPGIRRRNDVDRRSRGRRPEVQARDREQDRRQG